MKRLLTTLLVTISLFALGASSAVAAVTLTDQGKPVAAILIQTQASDAQAQAALELQTHLQKISGATLPIVKVDDLKDASLKAYKNLVILGDLVTDSAVIKATHKASDDQATFTLAAKGHRIQIKGNGDDGTAYGVFELLEQLGVRWFYPGEMGTVIPHIPSVTVKDQLTTQAPSFAGRYAAPTDKTWQHHNRMGGPYFVAAHGMPGFTGRNGKALFKAHPECFALNAATGKRSMRQLCVSNPETLKYAVEAIRAIMKKNPDRRVIGLGPNDGGGDCQGDNCRALDAGDWDPFANTVSLTDRYMWFYNQILDKIGKEYPDLQIQTYLYATYIRPPVKVKPNPRINGALAPITLCRIHGPNNPICPEGHYYAQLATEWGKLIPRLYDRGYWFNLADPGMPFIFVSRLREQIPLAKKLGIYGWRVETVHHWASENPSLWVAGKLMWNCDADVDALMKDFAQKYYGPAAAPMLKYTWLIDSARHDADYHTGSAFDMPHIYTKAIRDQARGLLNQAAKLASDPDAPESLYAKRVELTRKDLDYLEAFVDMIESRNRLDFVASYKALQREDAIQHDLLTSYDIPMLAPRAAKNYLRRFFRQATEQAYARVTDGNVMVAGLKDQWQFLLDPDALGEALGYQNPDVTGGNWQPLLTSSQSWGNQGLRYYKSEAWYRQRVDIPAKFKGKRVFLWFGGVDEKAKVFVNGKEVGISSGATFIPFELDVTDAILPGQSNLVAVRIINKKLNELGTGGIMSPVMFYAPAKGKDAELQNVRKLSETFP